jgi:hypothetical protein
MDCNNDSIGIIFINICDQENVEVAFPLTDGIKTFTVQKDAHLMVCQQKELNFYYKLLLH